MNPWTTILNPYVTVEAFQRRIAEDLGHIAGESVTAEVKADEYYVFCSELGMYRIADVYKYNSKGFSQNLNTWYICIPHGIALVDFQRKDGGNA